MRSSFTNRQLFTTLFTLFIGLLAASALSAWTGPTATAPAGNVAAPINVGTSDQVKNAGLSVNALAVFGSGYVQNKLGINKTSPVVALQVNGTMMVANGGEVCQGVTAGGIRYNSGTNVLEFCDGSTWQTIATIFKPQVFAYSTPGTYTWNKPSGGTTAILECWGGGGGGGGGSAGLGDAPGGGGGGGGGGGYFTRSVAVSSLPSTVTVTIGSGGAGGPAIGGSFVPGNSGSSGGNSSFGSYITAYGGGGGPSQNTGPAGGLGGGGGSGSTEAGSSGGNGATSGTGPAAGTGSSCSGGGGGGGGSNATRYSSPYGPASGGTSGCGGSGGSGGPSSVPGTDGGTGGGGGGGGGGAAGYGAAGGNGGSGKCVITVS